MGRTSIPCSNETRDRLASLKVDDETWDDCLTRLADDTAAGPDRDDHVETVLTELRQLREQIDAGNSDEVTINAIREAVRIDVRDQLAEFRR